MATPPRDEILEHLSLIRNVMAKNSDRISKDDQALCEQSLQFLQKSLETLQGKTLSQISTRSAGSSTTRIVRQTAKFDNSEKASSEAQLLYDKIAPLMNKLLEQKIYIGYKLNTFFQKSEEFLKQVPDVEWKKDTGIRFLSELISVLTQIHATYDHPTFSVLRKEVEEEILHVQEELSLRSVQTIPENIYSNKIDWESVSFIYGCSVKPKGQLISLQKFSLKKDGEVLQHGEAIVSCGYPSQVYDFLKNVEYVLLKNRVKYNSEYWTKTLSQKNNTNQLELH